MASGLAPVTPASMVVTYKAGGTSKKARVCHAQLIHGAPSECLEPDTPSTEHSMFTPDPQRHSKIGFSPLVVVECGGTTIFQDTKKKNSFPAGSSNSHSRKESETHGHPLPYPSKTETFRQKEGSLQNRIWRLTTLPHQSPHVASNIAQLPFCRNMGFLWAA